MTRLRRIVLCVLAMLLPPLAAHAHVTATGLADVAIDGAAVTYRLTVVPVELPEAAAQLLARATARDRGAAEQLAAAMRRAVTVRVDDAPCRPGRIVFREAPGKVLLDYNLNCPAAPGRLEITEDWGTLFGPHYVTIATIPSAQGGSEHLLGAGSPRVTVDLGMPGPSGLPGFIRLGIVHILTGYDHLLFLLALLIGASSFWRVLGIASAFTLAHSITLSLAVLDVVRVPGAIVEPAIAASIVFVAVENVIGVGPPWRRIAVTFGFGLVHGLGFADVLQNLALSGWPLVQALFGFNIGVELGQAAAIIVVLPILLVIARRAQALALYRYASLAVAAVGLWWLADRVLP